MISVSAKPELPATVAMSRSRSDNRWQTYRWRIDWVLVGDIAVVNPQPPPADSDSFRYPGLCLRLHKDEAESYYHNLMAPTPSLFVVTRNEPDGTPKPFHLSASFDEAHAYSEAEEDAYALPLPPALCQLLESYVLTHYAPEPRKKRRRQDWRRAEP